MIKSINLNCWPADEMEVFFGSWMCCRYTDLDEHVETH